MLAHLGVPFFPSPSFALALVARNLCFFSTFVISSFIERKENNCINVTLQGKKHT
jgi:hypothetical protein